MPRSKRKDGSVAILPGSYEVAKVDIHTNDGQTLNIMDLVGEIAFTESLDSPFLECTMGILDANSYLEKLKFSGNERIDIAIARRDINGEPELIEKEMYLANINMFSKNAPGYSTYLFTCISKHAYLNQLQVVSRPFSGSPGALVERICKDYLDIEEMDINKDTKEIVKGVFPRMRPLMQIRWLARRSFDNGSPYYFYDTLANGVIFNSLENMQNGEVHETYNHEALQSHVVGSEDNYQTRKRQILALSMDNMNISKYINTPRGAYGASLHTLDIAEKEYKKVKYNYRNEKLLSLNQYTPLADNIKFKDRALEEYAEAKNHYISINSQAFGNNSNYHDPANTSILKANAYVSNLDSISVNIEIHGDFEIASGKKVKLAVRKGVDQSKSEESTLDKVLSGDYIVTNVRHSFADSFTQTLVLKKDSYIEDVNKIMKQEKA